LGIAAVGSTLTAVGFGLNLRDLKNSAASNKPYLESRGFSLAKDPLTLDLDADGKAIEAPKAEARGVDLDPAAKGSTFIERSQPREIEV
jgi:hypothetical protein